MNKSIGVDLTMRWVQVTVNACYSMDRECSHKDLHVKGVVTEHGNTRR